MKISIITPIYNTPLEYLQSYFNALNDQAHIKYEDVEICIINDGGVDPEIDLQSLSRFKVTYLNCSENHGPGHARQVGINYILKQDDNQLIIFMDSDDQFNTPLALSKYQYYYDNYHYKHGFIPDILQPTQQIWERPDPHRIDQLTYETIDMYFPDCLHGLGITSNFLHRTKVAFLDTYYHEDIIFTLELALHNPNICFMDYITSLHRTRLNSISYFEATELYDISRNVSVAQLLTKIPSLYIPYSYDNAKSEHAIYNVYIDRLNNSIFTNNNYDSIVYQTNEFAINCHWKYLNGLLQENYLSNQHFTYYADDYNICMQTYSLLKEKILATYPSDQYKTIQSYILTSLEQLFTQYQQSIDFSKKLECTLVAPVYNPNLESFAVFLQSINKQSYAPLLKLILVNDGSTSFPEENFFSTNIPNINIQFIHLTENHGVGYARQIGLQNITTPLYMLLDSDDEIATPYTVQHGIDYLIANPHTDGLVYYEQTERYNPTTDEIEEVQIITGSFTESSRLHGFMSRTKLIEQCGLSFKAVQYGEDGLFINQLYNNDLIIDVLPFIGYKHHKGYLTYAVYSPFANLNSLNDIYNYLYYSENNLSLIDELLYCAEISLAGPKNHETYPMVLLPTSFEDPYLRWTLKHYYGWLFVTSVPIPTLHDLLQDQSSMHKLQQCPFLRSLILQYVYYQNSDNVQFYYPPEQKIVSFETLEKNIFEWVHAEYYIHKNNERIPSQIMKNFPWNYKHYRCKHS